MQTAGSSLLLEQSSPVIDQRYPRRHPVGFFRGFEVRLMDGAPEEIRTPDPQIRSLVLYPAELRALCVSHGIIAGPASRPATPAIAIGSDAYWQADWLAARQRRLRRVGVDFDRSLGPHHGLHSLAT